MYEFFARSRRSGLLYAVCPSYHLLPNIRSSQLALDHRIHTREPQFSCVEQRNELPLRQRRQNLQPLSLCVPYSALPSNRSRYTVWSNFEIADLDFWHGPTYTASFESLELRGDFYYEVSQPFLSSPAPLSDGFFLAPTAVGRCACTLDCRGPIWRKGPDPHFARDQVRASPIHTLSNRGEHLAPGALYVRSRPELWCVPALCRCCFD